jgi:small subunit ribosomal protein S1
MRVTVAPNAGFCFGVRRAVELARARARQGPVKTLGPIIHNPGVVESLRQEGVRPVEGLADIAPGDQVVVRSHGVGRVVLDALGDTGAGIYDATCPFVRRIQQMALEASDQGRDVIVVGEGAHPEVQGILGWAQGRGRAILNETPKAPLKRPLVVSQTTLPRAQFEKVARRIAEVAPDAEIRDTICPATLVRQAEAATLAAESDVMLVVGGRESSNTRKLYELCSRLCPRTYFIEDARALDGVKFLPGDRVGVTAGASTPDCTLKEVVTRMDDIEKKEQVIEPIEAQDEVAQSAGTEAAAEPAQEPQEPQELQETAEPSESDDFMADVEKTLVQLRPGQTVTGTVVQISDDEVCVNVGYKADGLVKKADLSSTDVKIGDEIEVEVVKVNDGEGNVLLSQRNIVNRKHWEEIVSCYEAGEFVTGMGKEAVKGGLICDVKGVRAFVPASQLSLRFVERIEEFVGQELTLKVIEIDKAKRRIVASRKAVLQEEEAERKRQIWSTLTTGEIVKGIVRRLTDFGAFVDIGGVDGLVHVTDLSWGRVRHPSDVVSVNQEIDVKILNLDPVKERISLSYKQTQPRPWEVADQKYPIGSIVEGKVVRITTFGAFVELEPGLDGLVHISQCALTRIAKVEDAVNVGEIIRVKVLDVNPEARRISLSIRAVLEDEAFDGLSAPPAEEEFVIAASTSSLPMEPFEGEGEDA